MTTQDGRKAHPKAIVLAAAAMVSLAACGESVWRDAILWLNGAVDLNGDGKWTGNALDKNGRYSVCDGASAGCEMPDARHGALASADGQKQACGTVNADMYDDSAQARSFQIRTNAVHFTAWGNRTVEWPCLYMPQAPTGNASGNRFYSQHLKLNDEQKLIAGDQWTVLLRCRIDDFCTVGGASWIWKTMTDASKGGVSREIRLGFGRNAGNASDTGNYVRLCLGNSQPALTALPMDTNEWLEVAFVVDGRAESHRIRASLAMPNGARRYSDYVVPVNHEGYTTNFYPTAIVLGGPFLYTADGSKNGTGNFRGDIQMFAMWNRALSDREVCEAFGGGAPNLFRLGEEGCTAEMYGGAAPAAGEAITLNPLASDRRAFPTALTAGATFTIPFSVDMYSTNTAHWLRFSPQEGSAAGVVAVALDGVQVGRLYPKARAAGASAQSSYLYLKGEAFTPGDHVLALARTDGGAGSVAYDVVELGGGWNAGVLDNSSLDMAEEGSDAYYTWYPDSLNLKEFVRNVERNYALSRNRKKTVVWNLPEGAAQAFDMRLRYQFRWVYNNPSFCPVVTSVNGETVHTNSNVTGGNGGRVEVDLLSETGLLADGENVIEIQFSERNGGGGEDKATFDFLSIEPLRPKGGMKIIIR